MKETLKEKKARTEEIVRFLKKEYPKTECTLSYKDPLELLVATMLAAQCTDARVNLVTPVLFGKYPDVYALANADELELREVIRSTGFYKNKAKNIISCCKKIVSDFGGEVPGNMADLLTLSGVGRKTANLVLGDVFGIPGIVVDTHATRLSNRMGLTKNKEPHKIELDLLKLVEKDEQTDFCHRLVDHGRACCTASVPKCETCVLNSVCPKLI